MSYRTSLYVIDCCDRRFAAAALRIAVPSCQSYHAEGDFGPTAPLPAYFGSRSATSLHVDVGKTVASGKCVAWELGYAEVNGFYRAFRRWTGHNYSELKQLFV